MTKAEAGFLDVLKQVTISPSKAEELREAIVERWQQEPEFLHDLVANG